MKNISFIIGSGFSVAAKIPVVNDINKRLSSLTTDAFYSTGEGVTYFVPSEPGDTNWLEKAFTISLIDFYKSNCYLQNISFN